MTAPERDQAPTWLHLVRMNDRDLLNLCRLDVFRGSGRGGQKRNKTSNAVRLTLFGTAVTESASRSRDQNISNALRKLRLKIALNPQATIVRLNGKPPFPDEISPYLGNGFQRLSSKNPILPVLMGCVIDAFLACQGDWQEVAQAFGAGRNQLRRFVDKYPSLKAALNQLFNRLESQEREAGNKSD